MGSNNLGEVSDVDWKQGSANVDEYSYTYDADGNTTSRDNVTRGQTQTYTYDKLNVLASAQISGGTINSTDPEFPTTTWSLDSMGNRTGTDSYNSLNEDTSDTSDGNGDTTSLQVDGPSGTATMTYDAWGRVASATYSVNSGDGPVTLRYSYNALGQRVVAATDNGYANTAVFTVYDVGNNPIAEYSQNGALTDRYVWSAAGTSRLVLRDLISGSTTKRVYLLSDRGAGECVQSGHRPDHPVGSGGHGFRGSNALLRHSRCAG